MSRMPRRLPFTSCGRRASGAEIPKPRLQVAPARTEPALPLRHYIAVATNRGVTMRSGLLWLIGVPIPIILIIWLLTGHA